VAKICIVKHVNIIDRSDDGGCLFISLHIDNREIKLKLVDRCVAKLSLRKACGPDYTCRRNTLFMHVRASRKTSITIDQLHRFLSHRK
jgi:hypothetical protein